MELLFLKIALVAYLGAAVGLCLHLLSLHPAARLAGTVGLATAFAAHGASIFLRSLAAGYPAFTTEYEALSFFGWLTVGVYLGVQARYRLPAIGAVVAPLAFTVTLASFAFYAGVRELPPNLRSAWLPVHVTAAFLGNAVLALAFCVSLVYLLRERQLKEKRMRIDVFSRRLPSLETLDQLNYRALVWGFPLLTLGIVTGALFAKHTWGSFWSWDEREIFSLITWGLYAGLLEARMVAGWRGRRAATVTIVGFAVLLVSFVFGHLIFPGSKHGGSFD
jgi:cytochrome c-type biogenesis protein CcsB